MSTEELKPCPFCGGGAGIQNGPPHLWYVECYDCMVNGSIEHSESAAAESWNRRAAPAAGTVEKDAERWRAFRARRSYGDLSATDFVLQFEEDADAIIDAAIEAHNARKEQP